MFTVTSTTSYYEMQSIFSFFHSHRWMLYLNIIHIFVEWTLNFICLLIFYLRLQWYKINFVLIEIEEIRNCFVNLQLLCFQTVNFHKFVTHFKYRPEFNFQSCWLWSWSKTLNILLSLDSGHVRTCCNDTIILV